MIPELIILKKKVLSIYWKHSGLCSCKIRSLL